jgi:hypothetical protein
MQREGDKVEGEDEIDLQIECEYKRFQQNKCNGASTIKKREALKENVQQANSPDITFGRIK